MVAEAFAQGHKHLARFGKVLAARVVVRSALTPACRGGGPPPPKSRWPAMMPPRWPDPAALTPLSSLRSDGSRPAEREVIALRVFLDLDTQATAQVLGIAPGTVTAHLLPRAARRYKQPRSSLVHIFPRRCHPR